MLQSFSSQGNEPIRAPQHPEENIQVRTGWWPCWGPGDRGEVPMATESSHLNPREIKSSVRQNKSFLCGSASVSSAASGQAGLKCNLQHPAFKTAVHQGPLLSNSAEGRVSRTSLSHKVTHLSCQQTLHGFFTNKLSLRKPRCQVASS